MNSPDDDFNTAYFIRERNQKVTIAALCLLAGALLIKASFVMDERPWHDVYLYASAAALIYWPWPALQAMDAMYILRSGKDLLSETFTYRFSGGQLVAIWGAATLVPMLLLFWLFRP